MEDAGKLIRQAFQRAKHAGKPDWYEMTSAVLKSRMLNITGNNFSEVDYGYSNFTEFLFAHADLISIDTSKLPPMVRLLEANSPNTASVDDAPAKFRERIRRDLWLATLDYSSGSKYVWDVDEGKARPGEPGEEALVLPTINQDIIRQWRRELVERVSEVKANDADQSNQLDAWARIKLSTHKLPNELRHKWYEILKNKVNQRLTGWFDELGLERPNDLVASVQQARKARTDVEALRRLALRVVAEMTERELEHLSLPPRAVLKATKRSEL